MKQYIKQPPVHCLVEKKQQEPNQSQICQPNNVHQAEPEVSVAGFPEALDRFPDFSHLTRSFLYKILLLCAVLKQNITKTTLPTPPLFPGL
jgi:hypothetical protein